MASKSVLIIDTSILCVWLKVAGMERCGPDVDSWDFFRIDDEIRTHIECEYTLVLPLATIIESGNHIAHARENRRECAAALGEILVKVADEKTPWAAFSDQHELWGSENLKRLAEEWPDLAAKKLAIGDATIKQVAEYYSRMGCVVRILTGDQLLSSYEPAAHAVLKPRRRQYSVN